MKIEATGRGEIVIRLYLDEAWAALEREGIALNAGALEKALLREDEMQQDMAESPTVRPGPPRAEVVDLAALKASLKAMQATSPRREGGE